MLNILNIFSKVNDDYEIKPNSNKRNIQIYDNSFSPSLNQGSEFNRYKYKKSNKKSYRLGYLNNNISNIRTTEGFTGERNQSSVDNNDNTLTSQTNEIIKNNDYVDEQDKLSVLRNLYDISIKQYENLTKQITNNINGYVDRVNKNNPYLNKVVQFKTGEIGYVTNQGVVKRIPSDDVWKTLNIPQTIEMNLDISWSNKYNTPKIPIPTDPPLISGTEVKKYQSLGNEGSNVFVNQLLPSNIEDKYIGCYASNEKNDNMTFIGGSPPSLDITIENGNFSQPKLNNNTYEYITSATKVPGWYFGNAVLLNKSSAWGYPIPYPGGDQCVSIQKTAYIYSTLMLETGVEYTITFSACARDCCIKNANTGNPIEIKLHTNLDAFISSIETITPSPINTWVDYNITFNVPTSQSYRLYFSGTYNSGDQSTAISNIILKVKSGGSSGKYTYEDCRQEAIMGGYQFFGLQNVNMNTEKGYCAVSNSEPAVTEYGESKAVSKKILLWSSNTNDTGNTAILNDGTLQVIDSNGSPIYSTPVPDSIKTSPNPYVGCYSFKGIKEKELSQIGKNWEYTMNSCIDEATNQGYKYVGIGGPHRVGEIEENDQIRRCLVFNDLTAAKMNGTSTKCDNPYGANYVAALYETSNLEETTVTSYLILQDDGNMCIYTGSSPTDNQGLIWESGTDGKQLFPNSNMTAKKGKYGKNWIASGANLAPGDFIGSNDGTLALIMQTDGNLVLYTFELTSNCQKMSNEKMAGGIGGNAIYDMGITSYNDNMGKLGYIDADSNLYMYPNENQKYSNTYIVTQNYDTINNDISEASFSNATLESCQSACDKDDTCAGFVLNGNNCYPKTSKMYPFGGKTTYVNGSNIYVRSKEPDAPPLGVSFNTNNIDTVTYEKYIHKGAIGKEYGLAGINSVQKQQLEDIQGKIKQLSSEINKYTGEFESGTYSAQKQLQDNSDGTNIYMQDLSNINEKIKNITQYNNMDNILEDSDITVLQKNYNYLFWSILAAGSVLVSMSIVKN